MARRLLRLLPPILAGLVLVWSAAPIGAPVAAHGGGLPWIWIEEEAVMPGEPFRALVVDFAPYGTVTLEVRSGETTAPLGTIECEGDGHGEADLVVPATFPVGYAELVGRDRDGGEAVTLVKVGDVPDIGPPGPVTPGTGSPQASADWWQDPSVLTLAGLVGAAAVALAYMALRRRPTG